MADAFTANTTLRMLNLAWHDVCEDGRRALADAIKTNTLTGLALDGNDSFGPVVLAEVERARDSARPFHLGERSTR